jgi:hypothetical protein
MPPTLASTLLARLTELALRGLLGLIVAAPAVFAFVPTAQAASPAVALAGSTFNPTAPNDGGPLDIFQTRLLEMAEAVIKLILFVGAIVLAIAIPKGALTAQINHLFGSVEVPPWMDAIAAVVAKGICLTSMPLVDLIFKLFVPDGTLPVRIPVPGF